ncbi:MAG: endolytic transglycosylase MltG [Patescibacteria group bacterium]
MGKKIFLAFVLLIIAGAAGGALYFWNQVSWPASDSSDPVTFVVAKGQGVKEIGASLAQEKLIRDAYWFDTFVYLDRSERQFIAGRYQLRRNMTIREVVHALTAGSVDQERTITLLEGWTAKDIGQYLEEQGVVSAANFIAVASATDSRTAVPGATFPFLADKPAGATLEGYLFPDTYRIFNQASASDIVGRLLENFGTKYTEQMRADTAQGNMSIYQIVTLASIIEAEVKITLKNGQPINDDHYIVAGIFYSRLNKSIPLESDATINYVTSGSNPQPTAEDLSVDSPYNTYQYRGLPPGPIGNPSLEAITAAIYPKKTDYLYFLHKIHDDGSIVFSTTYEEHLANKQRYLQ